MMRSLMAVLAAWIVAAAGSAAAQTREDLVSAFAGDWFLFDLVHSAGSNPCSLSLTPDAGAGAAPMPMSASNCSGALAGVTTWNVEEARLVLYSADGTRTAELGGNQRRLTGTVLADDLGVVVERASGDGSNAEIAGAVQRHRCYFLGTTAECAGGEDLSMPAFPDADPRLAQVETLGNLLARSQPRRDATQVGTIPAGTCIRVNQCLVASDGIWCRARFGEVTAWLAKNAVRQGEWPIITYRNGCTEGGAG